MEEEFLKCKEITSTVRTYLHKEVRLHHTEADAYMHMPNLVNIKQIASVKFFLVGTPNGSLATEGLLVF